MLAKSSIDLQALITAFYRIVLRREPDSAGLNAHMHNVFTGRADIESTLAAFFKSEEFHALMPREQEGHPSSVRIRFTNDHSQFGEFGVLLRHWVNDAARHRIVVDVGARGRDRSNSFDLLREFNWQGLLIEANASLTESIRIDFAGLDFKLLNFAVSDYEGSAVFHIGINDDVSSLNVSNAGAWGDIQSTIAVQVRTLAPLLEEHKIPFDFDLLSLDIEGEDLKVFNNLIYTSKYRPLWVILEVSHNFQTWTLNDLDFSDLVKSDYRIIGQTSANLMLKRLV